MPAIGVAQAARLVVVFGEEERGVGAVGRVLVKELVHRPQEALRLIESDGALAAQIRLQIGHQESGGDSLSGNVADHQARAARGRDRGNRSNRRRPGEPGCRCPRTRAFSRRAEFAERAWPAPVLRFPVPGRRGVRLPASRPAARRCASMSRLTSSKLTSAKEFRSISSKRVNTPPQMRRLLARAPAGAGGPLGRRLVLDTPQSRRMTEANSALAPFAELGRDIFGNKDNLRGPADELVLLGVRAWARSE